MKNSSFDWDEIPTFLAKCVDGYIEPLTYLIHYSIAEGKFPSELKLAIVVRIYKSGDTSLITNYRPITVLCDRVSSPGGGVCLYLRKNLIYKICLKYFNSVCDLLILKILSSDLFFILVYRPPSSPLSDFDDSITKTRSFILSLQAPLPNIILLGDFNMPEVIWDNPHAYNPSYELLFDLATFLFFNQQVSTPTRKSNVLDLIFCSDELIKSVNVSECSLSDQCLIKTEIYIPGDPMTIQAKCINPPMLSFEKTG